MNIRTSNPNIAGAEWSGLASTIDDLPVQQLANGPIGELLNELLKDDMDSARLSRQFAAFYRLRPFIPIPIRQLLQRWRTSVVARKEGTADESKRGLDVFLPERLLETLISLPSHSIWPDQAEFSLVLTHDVETRFGVERMDRLAAIEESLGFRSSWNIIPNKYKTDPGLIRDLRARGHEIGVHGHNHDGRLFINKRIFESRVSEINAAIERLGAVGFRAPMVHRNLRWMQALNIDYDSSCFDADPFQAMPGGIGSFWPSIVGRFVELPYTMPQDHTLFVSMNQTADHIWREKLDVIRRYNGMVLMLTHPDYLDSPSTLSVYRDFLTYLKDTTDPWHVLPKEIATWTRQQFDATLETRQRRSGQV